jgi:spermidine synthase
VSPVVAFAMKFVSLANTSTATAPAYLIDLLSICLGALFFGATFPLIAHVSVGPTRHAGTKLSFLYAANIVGSTLGSCVVGFILMDHLSLFLISLLLLIGGVVFAAVVLAASGRLTGRLRLGAAFGVAAASLIVIGSRPVMSTI